VRLGATVHLMRQVIASRIMPRTTLDLDPSVLAELKRRQRREGKSLGRLVSELLSQKLDREALPPSHPFAWHTRPMAARVDLDDAEAVRRAITE
jgi:hypothetical protein